MRIKSIDLHDYYASFECEVNVLKRKKKVRSINQELK